MGNESSNLNFHYKSKNRTQSIIVENLDYFPYPPMPPKENVETELNEIISQVVLDPEKENLIRQQAPDIKWKIICRHKAALEQKMETIAKQPVVKSPVQIFIEKVHDNPSIGNLDDLRVWLEEKANSDDIHSFLIFEGLKTLLDILEMAEINCRITRNCHKQIIVLKILENLCNNNNQIVDKLIAYENGCNIIVMNFNTEYPELCNSVFEIFNIICWSPNTLGHTQVINAFNHLKSNKKLKYPFQPFIDLMQNEKNIVLIENAIAFINTLIESSVDEEERKNIRFQFNSCNLKHIYDKIREKILNEQYYIDDCLLQLNEDDANIDMRTMNRISLLGKTVYIEREQDEFEKHILQVINQIEVFEKTAEEGHIGSSLDLAESLNQQRRTTREKLDYTNVNSIFEKLKNDSMTNNTFPYFLEILNYMILIPRNNTGQLIWEKMAGVFAQASNLENDDWGTKLEEFKTLAKETRNIEDLEEFNTNLQTIVTTREEEINKLISEKNKYQVDLNKLSKETDEVLKKYQQIESTLEENLKEKEKDLQEKNEEIAKLKQTLQDKDSNNSKDLLSRIDILEKTLISKEEEIKTLSDQITQKQKEQRNSIISPPLMPPPLNNLLNGQIVPPPPLNLLRNTTDIPAPPLNLLGQTGLPPLPPPLNLLGQNGPPPLPPPINLLGQFGGPPPLPPPINLLGQNGPPPLLNLLGQTGPPPLANLLGQTGPPPLGNLLGQTGPPPLNLLGQPGPPPLNLLGQSGPPPLNLLGNKGPPSLNLMMPMVNQAVKKVKEKKKPRIPLRGLMWTLVPAANIKETIWEEINDEKIELDIDFIEKEFATKKPIASADPTKKPDDPATKQIIKVSLLPAEKNKNMEIVLGKLKLSNSTIRDALNQMDESILTLNNVESLLNIIPTEEEVKTVECFEGDQEYLGNPEKFSLEISKVIGYKERLLGMKFVKTYEDLVKELTTKTEKINSILENIPKNQKFRNLIEEILAIGNYLNGTGNRGGAYGFQLDALEKINDFKMANFPKKNLLMYVLEKYEKKTNESVIEMNEDLSDYDLASKTPLSQLQTDLGEIKKGAKIISNAINKSAEADELGKVEGYFKSSNEKLTQILEELDKKLKTLEQNYLNCCKYLCENPKDTPSDKLIEKIYKFWTTCKAAKSVLLKEKEAIRKEEEKKKKEIEKNTLKPGKILSGINSLKMGTADEIVETLKNRRQTKRININEMISKDPTLEKYYQENPLFEKSESIIETPKIDVKSKTDQPQKPEFQNEIKMAISAFNAEKSKGKPEIKVAKPSEIIKSEEKAKVEEKKTNESLKKSQTIMQNSQKTQNTESPKKPQKSDESTKTQNKQKIDENTKKIIQIAVESPEKMLEKEKSSPLYKKSGIIKNLELTEQEGFTQIPIRLSEQNKKLAPIAENKMMTPKKPNIPSLPENKSGGTIDYLSVLKKKPNAQTEKKGSPERSENLNYLANILTDGALKKKSVLGIPPLPPPKDKK